MSVHTVLRGAKFRPMDAQVCVLGLTDGQPLRLVPEPTNRFDPNAIQVHATNAEGVEHFIGYIAKEDCEDVLPLLAGPHKAYVAEACGNAPKITVEYDFGEDSEVWDDDPDSDSE